MSHADRYRALADRLFHARDLSAIDELFDDAYEGEYAGTAVRGRAAFRAGIEAILAGLADTRYVVHDTAEDGDRLWAHWTCTGTHAGALLGVAATGRPVTISGLTLNWFRGDKIVRGLVKWDRLALHEHLTA